MKEKIHIRLNPNSAYHSILIKKYGKQGALRELRSASMRYVFENCRAKVPKFAR